MGQCVVKRKTKDTRPSVEELSALVAFMRAQGVASLRVGDVEIALAGPAPYAPPAASTVPVEPGEVPKSDAFADDGAGLCACGHHPVVEHSSEGLCLHGCSASLCASTIGSAPEEG